MPSGHPINLSPISTPLKATSFPVNVHQLVATFVIWCNRGTIQREVDLLAHGNYRWVRPTCLKRLRWRISMSGRVHRLIFTMPCCSCLQWGHFQASSGASWNQSVRELSLHRVMSDQNPVRSKHVCIINSIHPSHCWCFKGRDNPKVVKGGVHHTSLSWGDILGQANIHAHLHTYGKFCELQVVYKTN